MQATARRLTAVSATSTPRRRQIRDVRSTNSATSMTKQRFSKVFVVCIAGVLLGYLIVTIMRRPGGKSNPGGSAPSATAAVSGTVFPEDLLLSWGYKTVSVDNGGHKIRSLKNYGDSTEAFYARFNLVVASCGSPAEAASEIERLKREHPMKEKDYRQFLQRGAVIYTVDPISNYSRLDHLPLLLKRIDEHFASQEP